MCLTTKTKEPFIADRDIPVLKALRKGNASYFMGDEYKYKRGANDPVGEVDIYPNDIYYSVGGGYLHAYRETDMITKKELTEILFGKNPVNGKKDGKVVRMYIPKGTDYYVDCTYNGVVCAKRLVWPRSYFLWNIRRKIREKRGF